MSATRAPGKVGGVALEWIKLPRGLSGVAIVKVAGCETAVRYLRERHTLWLEFSDRVVGFEFVGEVSDEHEKFYQVTERNEIREWDRLSFTHGNQADAATGAASKKKGIRIKSQMPGKIVRILVKPGDRVEKDQSLLVMEAMKMENEIRALQAGTIEKVGVSEGQAVETGTELITFLAGV